VCNILFATLAEAELPRFMFRLTRLKFALGPAFSGTNGNIDYFKVFIPTKDRIKTSLCNYIQAA
jgi:hypothetical protein